MSSGTVTIEIEAPGFGFHGTYPEAAFDSAAFMELMTRGGRTWEVAFPEPVPLPVGTTATITLPEFEFQVRALVRAVDGRVVWLTDSDRG